MDYTAILGAWAATLVGPCAIAWLAGDWVGSARTRRHYEDAGHALRGPIEGDVSEKTSDKGRGQAHDKTLVFKEKADALIAARAPVCGAKDASLDELVHDALLRQQYRAACVDTLILVETRADTQTHIQTHTHAQANGFYVVDDSLAHAEDHRIMAMPVRREWGASGRPDRCL